MFITILCVVAFMLGFALSVVGATGLTFLLAMSHGKKLDNVCLLSAGVGCTLMLGAVHFFPS